jgi:hypothetical protein
MVYGYRRSLLVLYATKVLYKLQKLYTCNLCEGKVTCVKIKKSSGTLMSLWYIDARLYLPLFSLMY